MLSELLFCYFLSLNTISIEAIVSDKLCFTPDGNSGECTSIYSCPKLLKALASLEPTVIEFARKSQCGIDKDFLVCCDEIAIDTRISGDMAKEEVDDSEILPDTTLCGFQASDDRVQKTNKTALDEFPWVAIINYDGEETCAGTFIALRYVLTAAHCIISNPLKLSVTLGTFFDPKNTSCTDEMCATTVKVESVVIHEKYKSFRFNYDIALLRLSGPVYYTDYIRPICLPFDEHPQKPTIGDTVYTSGWGKKGHLEVKKKITHKIVSNAECAKRFASSPKMDDNFFCTTSDYELSVCGGDAGGPMMYPRNYQWFLEGLITFRTGRCFRDTPEGYLNVRKFLDWIVSNVRP